MDFDWIDAPFNLRALLPKEIEESFEDPFSLRLLPDGEIATEGQSRYFNLGKTVGNRSVFSIFWSDGKKIRCIFSREMTPEEAAFYERKNQEML